MLDQRDARRARSRRRGRTPYADGPPSAGESIPAAQPLKLLLPLAYSSIRREAIHITSNERAISQKALANLTGLDRSQMRKIECGERNVSILNVIRISAVLNVPPSELFRLARL
ncbi:helix-turn-helix transcriptional regulator [Burkholderia sp. BCC0405]|uniref:helix-turn-helix domain-containing protein n=1 Tax=Burkholderia sp. BCC0405 TaxID=2676298 RepID=UPI00244576DB|nr:helix-turn-helix transcriptional regulator [Burkholderia sp. BCC0405]